MSQRDQEVPTRHFAAGSARTSSDCVVVTGASFGIGAETAVALARRGIAVAIAARRGARLAETATRCEAAGGQAHPVVADVTRSGDVEALRDRALERFGGVFAWVNNVGRGNSRPVEAMTEEGLDAMLAVNLKSALFGMQAIIPHFCQRDEGVIVNVGSILGRVPSALRGGYAAAKHALLGLSGCLRQELAAEG
jgi:short-subunit dehydrogenase